VILVGNNKLYKIIIKDVKQLVIEFTNKKEVIIQKKLKRFEELKIGYFEQNLSDTEEIELNEIENWLKIHNSIAM